MNSAVPLEAVTAPQERRCPECGAEVRHDPARPRQLFCTPPHQRAWNRRWRQRGGALAPFAAAARITRDGTRGDRATGKAAVRIVAQLITRYAQQDAEKDRMAIVDYVRLRIALGWEPL